MDRVRMLGRVSRTATMYRAGFAGFGNEVDGQIQIRFLLQEGVLLLLLIYHESSFMRLNTTFEYVYI